MKKTVRILAVFMIIAMLTLTLASCGKTLSGKYKGSFLGFETTFEFKGNKVTKTSGIGGYTKSVEGTYEIVKSEENSEKYVIKFTFGDETTTSSFSEGTIDGEKIIIIDGMDFKKVD